MPCRVCGWGPSAPARFKGFSRLYFRPRLGIQEGSFCRDCGIALFRTLTGRAISVFWYPYAFPVVPFLVIGNLMQRRRVARLAPPQQLAEAPTAVARLLARNAGKDLPPRDRPLPVGKPLYARRDIAGLLAPILLAVIVVVLFLQTAGNTGPAWER
jgi:hypothetical protein